MAKIRGGKRFFRIGRVDIDDVAYNYGEGASGYSSATVTGAGFDMRFFQVSEGNFSLGASPTVEEQPVLRGTVGVHYAEKTGINVAGDIGVLMHPETIRWFLDAGLLRNANGELFEHTIQEFYPGIDASEKGATYHGCKVSQIAGSWGSGNNKATITTSWQGQREEAYTGTLPTVVPWPTTKAGYFFTLSGLIDLSTSGVTLPVCDYSEVSFQVANNLAEGPRCFDADATLRGAISDLIAGQERITGSFSLQWRDLSALTLLRNFTTAKMRNIFIHPTSDTSLTVSGAETAGSSVVVEVSANPTTLLAVGDVVAFQHKSGGATTTNWSTGVVTARATGPNTVTIETLDINLSAGDVIWTEALEIRFNSININKLDKQGGPDDSVIVMQGGFQGKADSSGAQVTYRAKGTVLPLT